MVTIVVRHEVNASTEVLLITNQRRATWVKASKKAIENLKSQKKRK
jgi:hypothetical protein